MYGTKISNNATFSKNTLTRLKNGVEIIFAQKLLVNCTKNTE